MFSKSLFRQSCKANGLMWIIITAAVCFMLACVMLIAGNGDLGNTKVVIEDAVVEGELKAQTESRAIEYYDVMDGALAHFDGVFAANFHPTGDTPQEIQSAVVAAAQTAIGSLKQNYVGGLLTAAAVAPDSTEGKELTAVAMYPVYPDAIVDESGKPLVDFSEVEKPEYSALYAEILQTDADAVTVHKTHRNEFAMRHAGNFLAVNMTSEQNISLMLSQLKEYAITLDKLHTFGYDDYTFVHDLAENTVVDYRANLAYRLDKIDRTNMTDEQIAAQEKAIRDELRVELSKGLLASLPTDVSEALKEIGSADLYGTLVGSIFFKMAGLLLPIIYMIMSSNALIAGQVDSGSMAYVLSTGTKRKEVTFTQAVYLIGSLLAMFACTTVTSLICFAIVDVGTKLTYGKLLLINLGAFFVMFAMSGICFLASCVFNRSKRSMALGGGLNMFFLVATMLGLFGSDVLPSIIRMKALDTFNYVSLISLFDVISILESTLTFLWKWAILLVIGIVCYVIGSIRFQKKDLPL